MIFKRFYNEKLAQASFLAGSDGQAVVIDPNRHADAYIEAAAAEGLRIVAVTETHIHADYLSGSRELAQRTGATLYLSDEGDVDWKYGYASEPNVRLVRNGDAIRVGQLRLDIVHTPGHTPEHISFVATDEATSAEPLGVFTGDFVFVGDVGRPDLLERAANLKGTMEKGARVLYRSLTEVRRRPGHLMLWPGHGAGSACGKALGGVPFSTLAYESASNWAFSAPDEEAFVAEVLEGQPEPPVYFKQMKQLNKEGPPLLAGVRLPSRLSGEAIHRVMEEEATVVDVRAYGEYATGFIPGTLNIPLDKSFVNWAGWFVSYEKPIYLIAPDAEAAVEAATDLQLIGLDDVRGWLGRDALRAYEIAHGTLPISPQIGMAEAVRRSERGEAALVDVRGLSEWEAGHAPGAIHATLGYLPRGEADLPKDRPLLVYCGGGTRSAIGAAVLRRLGYSNVANIPGGFYEYRELGLPIETGPAPEPAAR